MIAIRWSKRFAALQENGMEYEDSYPFTSCWQNVKEDITKHVSFTLRLFAIMLYTSSESHISFINLHMTTL